MPSHPGANGLGPDATVRGDATNTLPAAAAAATAAQTATIASTVLFIQLPFLVAAFCKGLDAHFNARASARESGSRPLAAPDSSERGGRHICPPPAARIGLAVQGAAGASVAPLLLQDVVVAVDRLVGVPGHGAEVPRALVRALLAAPVVPCVPERVVDRLAVLVARDVDG